MVVYPAKVKDRKIAYVVHWFSKAGKYEALFFVDKPMAVEFLESVKSIDKQAMFFERIVQ